MDRFEFGLPFPLDGEDHLGRARNVKLYDGDHKTQYEGGELILTSHRLLWAQPGIIDQGLTCFVLPLSRISTVEEDMPSPFSFTRSPKIIVHFHPSSSSDKNPGPVPTSLYNSIKLSFKDGLDEKFSSALSAALSMKKWEAPIPSPISPSKQPPPRIKPRTGIVGIERRLEERQKAADETISVAFQDLNKLMVMAKDMVNISKTISNKIREKQGSITEDETIQFKSYLLSLGIDDPVTRGSYSNESTYFNNLAKQIVEILTIPIQEQGGMMSMADAYCRVNRARGMELLSPEDLLAACQLLDKLNLPLRMRVFDSGVRVLQLATHDDETVVRETIEQMERSGSLTPEDVSQKLGISILLSKERLVTTEKRGHICRDESIEGLRFYPNLFIKNA